MVPSYVSGGNYHHHLQHQYHQPNQQHPPHHHNQRQGQRHRQNLQQNLHNSHSSVEIPREPLRKAFYIKVKDFATQYNISVPLVKQNNKDCKENQSKHVKEGECADEEHKTDTNDRLEEEKENETLLNQEHGSNAIISTSKEGINKDLTMRKTTGTTSIDGKDESTSSYRSEQDQKEEGKDNDNDDDVILLNKSGSNSNQSFTNDQYANLGSGGFGGTSSVATSTLHHGGASTSMQHQQQHQYRQKNPSSGYNLCVLVGKVEIVVDKLRVDGSRVLLAEVQVGDETGCISLRARDQQIDILQNISKKAGAVILRNCTVELFKGKHLRLAVTKWGKLSVYPDNVPSTPMPPLSIDKETNFSTVDLNDVILSRNSHSPLLLSHPSLITTTNIFQEPSTGEKPGRRPSSASVAGASSVMSHSSFDAPFFPGMDTMPYSQQQQQHYHPNSQPPLGMMGGYQHSPLLMQPQYNPYYYQHQQQHPQYHGAHGFYHTPPTPLSHAISENKNTNLDNKSSESSRHRPIANLAFLNQQQHSPSYNVSTDSTTTMGTMPSVPYSNMHHSMPNVPPSLPHLQQHYDSNPNFASYADPSFSMVNHHQYSFSPTGNFSGPGKRTLRKGKQHQNYSTHRQHAKQNQPKKFQSQNRFPQHQYPPTETRSNSNTLAIPGIMRTISMDSHHTQSATSTLAINAPSFYPSDLNTPNAAMGGENNNGAASATSNVATTPLYPRADQYTVYYPYGDGGPQSQVHHYVPSPDILHGSGHNNSMHQSHSGPPPPLSLGPPFYHHQNHLLVPPSGFGYGQQQAQLNVHPQNVTQTISEEALNEKICDSVEESETKSSAIGIPTIVHEDELYSEKSTGVDEKRAVNSPSIQTEKSYVSYADKAAASIQKKTT